VALNAVDVDGILTLKGLANKEKARTFSFNTSFFSAGMNWKGNTNLQLKFPSPFSDLQKQK